MLSRLPWTPAPEAKPLPKPKRLNPDRRRHFVTLVANFAKEAKANGDAATLLNFEGPLRHGLRARFCLEGWGWREADAFAADIVATALTRVGAKRPTWEEGQPEYSQQGAGALIERTRCARSGCHKPLPEGHRKFCSHICGSAHHAHITAIASRADGEAYSYVAGSRLWSDAP